MKHFAIIIIFALVLYSCNEEPNIDGTWILSHLVRSDGEIDYVEIGSRVILKTVGNKLNIRKFRTEKDGQVPMDTTVIFKLKNNSLEIETFQEFGVDMEFAEDSIVGTFPDGQIKQIIFKKLPAPKRKISWNPIGKFYQFNGNKGLAHADFLNDSTMFEYGSNNESVSAVKWWFEQVDDYYFLVLQNPISTYPILIDSSTNNSIYLKSIEDKVREYEYKEKSPVKAPELLGKWKLTDKKYENGLKEIHDPFSRNNIEQLTISKDSIILTINGRKIKSKWTLSGSGKLMFVADKKYRIFRVWELGQNELVLEIGKQRFDSQKFAVYRRE